MTVDVVPAEGSLTSITNGSPTGAEGLAPAERKDDAARYDGCPLGSSVMQSFPSGQAV